MITHDDLILLGEKWLKHGHDECKVGGRYIGSCGVILKEFVAGSCYEIADVIGFASSFSIVIECKASKQDFLNEQKKLHRQYKRQLGNYRYYLVPTGLLTAEDIPEGWGLLTTSGKQVSVVKPAPHHGDLEIRNVEYELLYSVARRIYLRGLLPKVYEPLPKEKHGTK